LIEDGIPPIKIEKRGGAFVRPGDRGDDHVPQRRRHCRSKKRRKEDETHFSFLEKG